MKERKKSVFIWTFWAGLGRVTVRGPCVTDVTSARQNPG